MGLSRSGNRWSDGRSSEDRTDDSHRNMPVSHDYSTYPLSLSSESADSRLQVGKGMAICTFGSGAMDPRPNQSGRKFVSIGYRNVCR